MNLKGQMMGSLTLKIFLLKKSTIKKLLKVMRFLKIKYSQSHGLFLEKNRN